MAKRNPMAWALALSVTLGAPLAALPAHAAPTPTSRTPVSQMKDVPSDHWAYNALRTLVDRYRVMEGYPDETFRGNKTLTRYEFAAALAKVLAKVEQRIAQATGQSVAVDPGVNPEDMVTLARLQREFREELDALKSRVDTMDARLSALEKRVKITGKSRIDSRDYTGGAAADQPSADFRVRNSLMLDAELVDDLAFTGTLNVDLYSPQTSADGFERGASTGAMTDVYMPKALLVYTPEWATMNLGVGAFRDAMTLGSTLADPFKTNLWKNALGGYGFVGTPGLTPGAGPNAIAANAAGAVAWLPGTNVMVDVLDPNNSRGDLPTGDLLGSAEGKIGPFRIGLGLDRGALTGGSALPGQSLNVAASIPALRNWAQGDRLFGTIGFDFGMARLNGVIASPTNTLGTTGIEDKTAGLALDVGSEALSLSAEVIGNMNSLGFGGFRGTKGSVRLSTLNLLDSGFGLALGAVTGNANTAGAIFSASDYTSYGLMLKTPAVFVLPSLTLAAQNTAPGFFGGPAIGSGLTIGGDLNVWGLPTLSLEYSLGKFAAGADNALWGAGAFNSHQLAVSTQVKF